LPKRGTKNCVGYDFFAIEGFTLKPGEIKRVPTGYKANFGEREMLMIAVRSSLGFKYNVRMCNSIGFVECDYFNNESNEGHIWVPLQNEGDKDFVIEKGDAYVQGIFSNFLITDDDSATDTRKGGIGSTNKNKKERD